MPKAKQTLESKIGEVIAQAAASIADAVRRDMSEELEQLLAGRSFSAKLSARGAGASRRGGAGKRRNVPKECIHPDCEKPSKGPRWSFLCDDHKGIAKATKSQLLAAWKAQNAGEPEAQSAAKVSRKPRRRKPAKRASA